jgi:hypothetical protein
MKLALIAGSLLVSATAFADAPGADADDTAPPSAADPSAPVGYGNPDAPVGYADATGAPGNITPVVVAPVAQNPCGGGYRCNASYHELMQHRWAVGLNVGGLTTSRESNPDDKTNWSVGSIDIRFRVMPHLELVTELGGGSEKLMDGSEGDRSISMVSLGVRYRMLPTHKFNLWLSGALGVTTVASSSATDQERQDAQRPLGSLGVGMEYRFRHFALQAELKAIGTGPTKAEQDAKDTPLAEPVKDGMTGAIPPNVNPTVTTDRFAGGVFTIGASWYF